MSYTQYVTDTVQIPREEYERLQKDSQWLQALDAAGVDNWHGIGYAYELMETMFK